MACCFRLLFLLFFERARRQMLDQEGENDHLMKAVMRALSLAEEKVIPITRVGPFLVTRLMSPAAASRHPVTL